MKFGKAYKQVASKILGCSLASYYSWDKQKRPIISLLEKYFTQEDLEEFLETGEISSPTTQRLKKLEDKVSFLESILLVQNSIDDQTMADYAGAPIKTLQEWKQTKPELISTIIQSLINKGE
jgi:hypothetical protein